MPVDPTSPRNPRCHQNPVMVLQLPAKLNQGLLHMLMHALARAASLLRDAKRSISASVLRVYRRLSAQAKESKITFIL
jgi:hypothetical protein